MRSKPLSIVVEWCLKNKKQFDLPWRRTRDPYAILVSEIMLQQTQIARVIPKYKEWLEKFPTLESLARAPFPKVLKVWQGMGYNRRARYLKDAAGVIAEKYKGQVPKDPKILQTLPGIGHYSARAICCFAYGKCEPFLETNIRRTLIYFLSHKKETKFTIPHSKLSLLHERRIPDGELLHILSEIEPKTKKRDWYWALMDYGREVLGKMADNPNRHAKNYRVQSRFLGSRRYVRAKVISYLVAKQKGASEKELHSLLLYDSNTKLFLDPKIFFEILKNLERDQLIMKKATRWQIVQ